MSALLDDQRLALEAALASNAALRENQQNLTVQLADAIGSVKALQARLEGVQEEVRDARVRRADAEMHLHAVQSKILDMGRHGAGDSEVSTTDGNDDDGRKVWHMRGEGGWGNGGRRGGCAGAACPLGDG